MRGGGPAPLYHARSPMPVFRARIRERIATACRLTTTGKVFALGIPLERNGPQSGTRQRFNPIHTMFRDAGDAPRSRRPCR
jgi:hypothetical protein